MKKNAILIIASICVFTGVGCKKEVVEAPVCNNVTSTPTANTYHLPITVGSYWIYERISIDSTNIITPSITLIDSVFIPYDTLINGKMYACKKVINAFNSSYPTSVTSAHVGSFYVRDSAGYMVNPQGKFIKYDDFDNIISFASISNPLPYTIVGRMTHKDSIVTVPAGTFTTVNYQQTVTVQEPSYAGNRTRYNNRIIANNIGVVYSDMSFYSTSNFKTGIRLLRYHIAD